MFTTKRLLHTRDEQAHQLPMLLIIHLTPHQNVESLLSPPPPPCMGRNPPDVRGSTDQAVNVGLFNMPVGMKPAMLWSWHGERCLESRCAGGMVYGYGLRSLLFKHA